jgi:hypothetical protein
MAGKRKPVCRICGQPVLVSKNDFEERTVIDSRGQKTMWWHNQCVEARRQAQAAAR